MCDATPEKLEWLPVTSPQLTAPGISSVKGHSRGCLIKHVPPRHKGRDVASLSLCSWRGNRLHTHARCGAKGAVFEPSAPPVSLLCYSLMNAREVKSSLVRIVKTSEISQSGFCLVLSTNVIFDNQRALWQMPLELNESDIIICMFPSLGLQPAHFTDEWGSVQRGYLSQNLWIQWAARYKMGIFLLPGISLK